MNFKSVDQIIDYIFYIPKNNIPGHIVLLWTDEHVVFPRLPATQSNYKNWELDTAAAIIKMSRAQQPELILYQCSTTSIESNNNPPRGKNPHLVYAWCWSPCPI